MKAKPTLDPAAAFPNPKAEPDDAALSAALASAFAPLRDVLAQLRSACPQATTAWQYSDRIGWYRISLLKKRRLCYLLPRQGDFRLRLILGGKAVASLADGPHAAAVAKLLRTATLYPEGTLFEFDRTSTRPALIAALLAAKIAH